MFKSSSESQNYLRRVASHSTKGSPSGRVVVLPPAARPQEFLYASLKDQIANTKVRLCEVDRAIAKGSNYEEITLLRKQRDSIKSTEAKLRIAATNAGQKSYDRVFREVAELLLTRELFKSIDMETEGLMGRRRVELGSKK
jgi:hypothetical protein